jgi:hypothetical protein
MMTIIEPPGAVQSALPGALFFAVFALLRIRPNTVWKNFNCNLARPGQARKMIPERTISELIQDPLATNPFSEIDCGD